MSIRIDTEFTAQPLTYFVRSLGLESSFHLTTGTFNQIVKDQSRIPPERLVFDFRLVNPTADLSSKPAVSLWPQPLETNLLILARFVAARQLAFCNLLTLLVPFRLIPGGALIRSTQRDYDQAANLVASTAYQLRPYCFSAEC